LEYNSWGHFLIFCKILSIFWFFDKAYIIFIRNVSLFKKGEIMKSLLKNNKGVALVYVLMALVCVGAVASLVLHMAKKESTDSSLRVSSEVSRFAATAGLTYGANFFTDPKNDTRSGELLKIWYDNYKKGSGDLSKIQEKDLWIVGSPTSYSDPAETDGMKFRVKIVNMDFSKVQPVTKDGELVNDPEKSPIKVLLQSESIDKSGSKASSLGSYEIFGYENNEINSNLPESALYMGSGADEIDVKVEVNGGTFMKGSGFIAHSGHIFNGEFKRIGTNNSFLNMNPSTFMGPAYFGATPGFSAPVLFAAGPSTFKKGIGLESYGETQNGPSDPIVTEVHF
jgi:hypothetical protein